MDLHTPLANPPFNMKGWGGKYVREDKGWKFGVPSVGNGHFAWVQRTTPSFEHNPAIKGMLPKG